MPTFRGGFSQRAYAGGAVAPPSSTATLSGTVKDGSNNAVASGRVQLLSGSTQIALVAVTAGGVYSIPNITPGSYTVKLHPSLQWCLGNAESDSYAVNATSGGTPTQNFVVQATIRAADFQSVTTDAQLRAGTNWWTGTGYSNTTSSPSQVFIDATGGPSGDKAGRYDFVYTPWNGTDPLHNGGGTGYCDIAQTIAMFPRVTVSTLTSADFWVRILCKESANFLTGGSVCQGVVGMSYKYALLNVEDSILNHYGRFGTYLASAVAGIPSAITMDMSSTGNATTQPAGTALPGGFIGSWNSIVMHISGAGTASCTFELYIDGTLQQSINGPFFQSTAITGMSMYVELGANINNGPDTNIQQRWFREFGLYDKRPNMLASVSV